MLHISVLNYFNGESGKLSQTKNPIFTTKIVFRKSKKYFLRPKWLSLEKQLRGIGSLCWNSFQCLHYTRKTSPHWYHLILIPENHDFFDWKWHSKSAFFRPKITLKPPFFGRSAAFELHTYWLRCRVYIAISLWYRHMKSYTERPAWGGG